MKSFRFLCSSSSCVLDGLSLLKYLTVTTYIAPNTSLVNVFGYQTGRRKILHQIIASIPLLPSAINFFLNRILIR
jgi:hypothetical protein